MKELSIEEKARAYDKAIERAKELLYVSDKESLQCKTIESVLPELKENEDENADEKVRKALIKLVTNHASIDLFIEYDIHLDEALSWLEKQGEHANFRSKIQVGDKVTRNEDGMLVNLSQLDRVAKKHNITGIGSKNAQGKLGEMIKNLKPADKVEPKFHEGQWIVFNGLTLYIKKVVNGFYRTITRDGTPYSYTWNIDNVARLWTIQDDAKNGDVLVNWNNTIYLFKGIEEEEVVKFYCFYNTNCEEFKTPLDNNSHLGLTEPQFEHHPATKEQRDLLFQKMKEAGYEFDFGKKELKKIHIIDEGKAEMDYCFTKMMDGQKVSSAWSEEDENRFSNLIFLVKRSGENEATKKGFIDFINRLKFIRPKKSAAWSEDDEELAQAKKDAYNDALDKIEYHSGEPTFDDGWDAAIWYLKKRNAISQPHWKPSEEQMEALWCAAEYYIEKNEQTRILYGKVLESLYDQLKQL